MAGLEDATADVSHSPTREGNYESHKKAMLTMQDFDTKLKAILDGSAKENPDHPTILFEMLRSELPPEDKEIQRLNEEAQLLVAAGLITAAWAMSVTSFHVIQSPAIHDRLRQELLDALPKEDFSWSQVENLPYLNACIREGLRFSHGVTARSPRLWDKELQYADWTIPARTPVSLTIYDHNVNEEVFPDHDRFNPDRWLDTEGKLDKSMDQWHFAFGKGSRSCLGIK